jgi:electron transfer flavoprotein beta subunit
VHIVVPIKQVPETSNVKMDPVTGTMIRAGVGTVVNPLDLFAIETAVRLKEAHGGRITTLTMGPRGAEKALREAIAMGCDDGVLISDRAFAGSDSWSTSYTLAQAIRTLGAFDLIVAGERATDGDTGQVGPGIAAWLDLPVATYVAAITRVEPARADAPARGARGSPSSGSSRRATRWSTCPCPRS